MKNEVVNLKKFWIHQYRSKKIQKLKKKGCLHIRIHNRFAEQLQNQPYYQFFE